MRRIRQSGTQSFHIRYKQITTSLLCATPLRHAPNKADIFCGFVFFWLSLYHNTAGWSSWQLVGLITQRSEVQVLPPLLRQTRLSYMRALSVLWKYYEIFDLNRRLVYLRILCRISLGDSPYPPIRIVRIGYPVVHPVVDGRYQYLPLAFIKPNFLPSYGSPSTTI